MLSERDEKVIDLYRLERAALLRLAVLLVGDRVLAEDLVQDAFVMLHRRWNSPS
jgi:DNA-directed RNA polymerase specialized sigma24 family protein